jgi:hypothetical protein
MEMKKIFIFVFVSIILTLGGCSFRGKTDINISATQGDTVSSAKVESVEAEKEFTFVSNIENISDLMYLKKDEVLDKFGNDFVIVPEGGEGTEEGYMYEQFGLTFVFEGADNHIAWVSCSEKVDINGARTGMNFKQIQDKLGVAEINDTFIEIPEYRAFEINYRIGDCIVNFFSQDEEGKNAGATVFRYE